MTKQYQALLKTEGLTLEFGADAIEALASYAQEANTRNENIGARRLHTVMERLLDQLSFDAADRDGETLQIDADYVEAQLGELVRDEDLSRYIL